MSLDIDLIRKKKVSYDDGATWEEDKDIVYSCNITHNLAEMAGEAGIYEALWKPYRLRPDYVPTDDYNKEMEFEESCEILAEEVIPIIEKGLKDMKARPEHYKKFDSPNGWGLYVNFVPRIEKYLTACKENPKAIIEIWR